MNMVSEVGLNMLFRPPMCI